MANDLNQTDPLFGAPGRIDKMGSALKQTEKTIADIEDHLTDTITLDGLARSVGVSRYHLQRI